MSCSTLGPVGQKQMEKVVCTHTCETDTFFFQMVHCCYISQVIYKRWQWDDNPVLCRLHSPLQVNYSLRGKPSDGKKHLVYYTSGSLHNCVVFLYLGNRHWPLSCCWICSNCSFYEVVKMLDVGCWMLNLDVGCWCLIFMLDVWFGCWMLDLDV